MIPTFAPAKADAPSGNPILEAQYTGSSRLLCEEIFRRGRCIGPLHRFSPPHALSLEAPQRFNPQHLLNGPAGRLEAVLNTGSPHAPFAALVCHPHPAVRRQTPQQGRLSRHEGSQRSGMGAGLAGSALQLSRHRPEPGQCTMAKPKPAMCWPLSMA